MKKNILTTLAIVASIQKTAVAADYQSPRVLALGGSSRAAPLLNDAIYQNPSYASFIQVYSLSFGYNWFDRGRNYNISIQDSKTETLQAGVGFTRREQNAVINLGGSKRIADDWAAGAGTKILIDDGTSKMTADMIVSGSFISSDWMYASLVIDNVFESDNGKTRGLLRSFYTPLKFIPTKEIQVFVDPVYTPNYARGRKAGYSIGTEISLLADFYLRLGKFQDTEVVHLNTRGEGFGMGVGWIGPKVNFNYALHRTTQTHNGTDLTTSNSVEMTVFF